MMEDRLPIYTIAGLGITQIVAYGTLYYSFSILAPQMARDFSLSSEWIFGALSVALLIGGLSAPLLGRLIDKFGAGQIMTLGSLFAATALAICSLSSDRGAFILSLTLIEVTANLVQYGAAFALLVQIKPAVAQRSITYLTLIAGFASTIFWPITASLQQHITWQQIYIIFAGMNLIICLPIHFMITRSVKVSMRKRVNGTSAKSHKVGSLTQKNRRRGFLFLLVGLSLQALVSSAILVHMVPLLSSLSLGATAAIIGSLFGPSQVASRLINMFYGRNITPIMLAAISAGLISLSVCVLIIGEPTIISAVAFACLFGLGNGLFSIVSGTLPLALFGSVGYGSLQGKIMSGRLIVSAAAPFALAMAMSTIGTIWALFSMAGIVSVSVFAFVSIRRLNQQ